MNVVRGVHSTGLEMSGHFLCGAEPDVVGHAPLSPWAFDLCIGYSEGMVTHALMWIGLSPTIQ